MEDKLMHNINGPTMTPQEHSQALSLAMAMQYMGIPLGSRGLQVMGCWGGAPPRTRLGQARRAVWTCMVVIGDAMTDPV